MLQHTLLQVLSADYTPPGLKLTPILFTTHRCGERPNVVVEEPPTELLPDVPGTAAPPRWEACAMPSSSLRNDSSVHASAARAH